MSLKSEVPFKTEFHQVMVRQGDFAWKALSIVVQSHALFREEKLDRGDTRQGVLGNAPKINLIPVNTEQKPTSDSEHFDGLHCIEIT